MRKLILRWVALALVLTAMAYGCVLLGEWQLSRLEHRRESNSVLATNREQPPVPYDSLMGATVAPELQWRRVELTGRYGAEQYQVRYRSQGGVPGIEVATVFTTTQGDELLVDRGFIPREDGKPDVDVLPPPPSGVVSMVGYLRADETGDANAATPNDFRVRLIDATAIGASLGRELLPGYVSLISSDPGETTVTPLTPPEPGEGNHFSYALQWFAFGVIAVVGIGVLIRADLQDRRKARLRAERRRAAAAVAGEPSNGEAPAAVGR